MTKVKIPLAKPYIDQKDINGVIETLKSGWLSCGPKITRFETSFAQYITRENAVAVSSGTAGLHLAVKSLNLKPGDEIVTTSLSFIASANCLLYENIKPVFVDVQENSFNIDPTKIEEKITNKTKAILIVHLFGQSADMDPIIKMAKGYNLYLIEDACQGIGSSYKGQKTGSLGDISVFAFYPNKQITTGEGGMVTTDSKQVSKQLKMLRNQGRDPASQKIDHQVLGYNYRMDEMSASLGITQLDKIEWIVKQRQALAQLYHRHLSKIPKIILPKVKDDRTHSWFVYIVRVLKNRDQIINKLSKKGIQTRAYLPAIHLQKPYRDKFGFQKGNFPTAEKLASQSIALPFYIGLEENDIQYIAQTLKKSL